jgi:hypothetical protein
MKWARNEKGEYRSEGYQILGIPLRSIDPRLRRGSFWFLIPPGTNPEDKVFPWLSLRSAKQAAERHKSTGSYSVETGSYRLETGAFLVEPAAKDSVLTD